MRYEITTFSDGLEVVKDLIPLITSGIEGHKINVQPSYYMAAEQVGYGFGLIAYDGNKPVGFVATFLMPHQHTGEFHAYGDVIFVLPEYRETMVPGRLIVLAEKEAKARGARFYIWSAREDSPLSQVLTKRVPPKLRYKTFVRELWA